MQRKGNIGSLLWEELLRVKQPSELKAALGFGDLGFGVGPPECQHVSLP